MISHHTPLRKPTAAVFALIASTLALGTDSLQQVSEPGGMGVDQHSALFCSTPSGILMVHSDERSGTSRSRLQPLNSTGIPLEASVGLSTLIGGESVSTIEKIASNARGDVVVLCHRSGSAPGRSLVRFDTTKGLTSGTLWSVLEDEGDLGNGVDIDVILAPDGRLLVLYTKDGTLLGRLHDEKMMQLGASFEIGAETNFFHSQDATFLSDGSFIVAWNGTRAPYFNSIRTQWWSTDATTWGDVIEHTAAELELIAGDEPVIAANDSGEALLLWSLSGSTQVLQAQMLDSAGNTLGDPVDISTGSDTALRFSDAQAKNQYEWTVVMQSPYSTGPLQVARLDMQAQTYTSTWEQSFVKSSVMVLDGGQEVLVGFESSEYSTTDVMGFLIDVTAGSNSDAMQLADDVDGADQYAQVLATSSAGHAIIAWTDERADEKAIYYQYFNTNGQPVGGNQYLMAAGTSGYPMVSMNSSGEALIGWREWDGSTTALRMQRINSAGQVTGVPMTSNNSSTSVYWNDTKVSLMDDGVALASWTVYRELPWPANYEIDLYMRCFDASGEALTSSPQKVNANSSLILSYDPIGAFVATDSTYRLFYKVSNRSNDQRWIRSHAVSTNGTLSGYEHTAYSTSSYLSSISIDCDDSGFSIAFVNWDDAFVRNFDAATNYLGQSMMSRQEMTSLSVQLEKDASGERWLLFEGIDAGENALRGRRLSSFADGTETVLPLSSIQLIGFEYPSFEFAGEKVLASCTVQSGTNQGEDIVLLSADHAGCSNADLNCDGTVNGVDLGYLLGYWGLPGGDITGDGTTDGADLTTLLGAWTG